MNDTTERNLPIREAARLMGKSDQFVRLGLQRGAFPFGTAVKVSSKYTYYISPKKFYEYIGREESTE
ncbi:hypothetical protein [Macellibacteroides fermentans]|uniref:hypothetical protein n=1 Tax=Macellibacteroides fermentans TaxID=879969 RepID=UPI00406C05F4